MGYELTSEISKKELCQKLGIRFSGLDTVIKGVSALSDQQEGYLTFSADPSKVGFGAVAFSPESLPKEGRGSLILVDSPRLEFVRALDYLLKNVGFRTFDFPSRIHDTASIGRNVVIEPGCVICENVIIEHNCIIHSGTTIGANTRVRAQANVGGDGFGFERFSDELPIRFPHLGGVWIGEYVEIGSLTTVARGTLSDTKIEDHVKIDNLVHVAHNCHIQQGAFLTACSELSGGVNVGRNAWIAPNVCVNQKLSIGANAVVGLGAVVTKDVPDNTVYAGNPARKLRDL